MTGQLVRCPCVASGHPNHAVDAACGRIFPDFGFWRCESREHAHPGDLTMIPGMGGLPPRDKCTMCSCPAIDAIPPEPAPKHLPGGGVGGDPVQAGLRAELEIQERVERGQG